MLRIPFHDVERGLQEAKAEATAYATELADSEHRKNHDRLVANAANVTAFILETRTAFTFLEQDIRECKYRLGVLEVQERSATAAVTASSRTHQSYTAEFRTHPYSEHPAAAAPTIMAPPPSRAPAHAGQQHNHLHTRPAQVPPAGRPDPPAAWAAITSRRPLQHSHLPTDDSYLNVRVSSLRHHSYDFTPTPRNAIFALATTTFDALEDVGRSKAFSRFALDLASATPSPLSRDIANGTLELCDHAQQMYSARNSPKWFSDAITRARESRTRNRRVQIDSSAGDRSVEERQPCHREEPTSGRGKAKRVMTALTTDSDTGPDSPGETDQDKRPPRQVFPRVFHAPDPPGVAPPFPPRIARPQGTRRTGPPCHSSAIQPILGAPTPHGNHFRTETPTTHLSRSPSK